MRIHVSNNENEEDVSNNENEDTLATMKMRIR